MSGSNLNHGERLGVLLSRAEMALEDLAAASDVDAVALRRFHDEHDGTAIDASEFMRIVSVLTPKVALGVVGDYLLGLGIDRLHQRKAVAS